MNIARNEEILKCLSQFFNIPDNVISLELNLEMNEAPRLKIKCYVSNKDSKDEQ